jgi:putative transposase
VSRTRDRPSGPTLLLPLQFLAAWLGVSFARVLQQQVDYLKAENRVLKKRLWENKLRLTDADRRRLAVLGKKLGRKVLAEVATIASPETILRWHRELVTKKCDGSKRGGPGRPKKRGESAELVVRMARENETWGYTRIRGALQNLGHKLGRNTIRRILQERGIDPAPERGKRMPWGKFIKAHVGAAAGLDFVAVGAAGLLNLARHYVSLATAIASRTVEVAGLGRDRRQMEKTARAHVAVEVEFLRGKQYLFFERWKPLGTEALPRMTGANSVKAQQPRGSPDLHEVAERFMHSINNDFLEGMVPLGEVHLRRKISEEVSNCRQEGRHQGLGAALSPSRIADPPGGSTVACRQPLSGLLSFPYREAA